MSSLRPSTTGSHYPCSCSCLAPIAPSGKGDHRTAIEAATYSWFYPRTTAFVRRPFVIGRDLPQEPRHCVETVRVNIVGCRNNLLASSLHPSFVGDDNHFPSPTGHRRSRDGSEQSFVVFEIKGRTGCGCCHK